MFGKWADVLKSVFSRISNKALLWQDIGRGKCALWIYRGIKKAGLSNPALQTNVVILGNEF